VIKPDNIASQRVAEKAGMARTGERHAYGELLVFYAVSAAAP
jgi:RimJ/RimL family protein N-acetyltransferase